jgi:D-cysteine desulfhydrase
MTESKSSIPLVRRFPALAALPRAVLGEFPTPVERLTSDGRLWIKRDDLTAPEWGGNKIRALEFLLGTVPRGTTVLTVGGVGSTHVLTLAAIAPRLGLRVRAVRWPHDLNAEAERTIRQLRGFEIESVVASGFASGMVHAVLERIRGGSYWIPLGGTTPVGMLGHVNAGLEMAEQIGNGEIPLPARVVIPFGTGGTSAGIALGLQLGGVRTLVTPVRVGPRLAGSRGLIRHRMKRVARLLRRLTGERVPLPLRAAMDVRQDWSGGAYGRPEPRAAMHARWLLNTTGIRLDGTYSEKAFGAARELARKSAPVVFWLTFDGRRLSGDEPGNSGEGSQRQAVRAGYGGNDRAN